MQEEVFKNQVAERMNDNLVTGLLYFGYTLASVVGLILMKLALSELAASRADWEALISPIMIVTLGALLYVGSWGLWMVILSRSALSTAYPVAVGLTLCLSSIAASVILKETIGLYKIVGMALVFSGIAIIFRE